MAYLTGVWYELQSKEGGVARFTDDYDVLAAHSQPAPSGASVAKRQKR